MAANIGTDKIPNTKRGPVWLGLAVSFLLTILVVVGSRNLEHYDSALFGYTIARYFVYLALVAWLVTFLGFLATLLRKSRAYLNASPK